MIYKGEFISTNKKLYEIKITTSQGNATKVVTLGGNPFVTAMDSEGKTIFAPAKYQSATISIITPDYNFDIYSGQAQGTKVELFESGVIVWTGYVTPNLYDMGFVEAREEIQIECIDALSTLQYIKYNSEDKTIITFLEIIRKLLRACNAYTSFYITNNIQLAKNVDSTILDKINIAEANFFDKKDDKETDEDVAWTMKEVLEEICQYLGITAIADGDKVYFLDYDAIKAGNQTYYKYSVNTDAEPELATLGFNKTIKAQDYTAANASLSLDEVYNKVTIEDDIYNINTIIPDLLDPSNLLRCSYGNDSSLTDERYKYKEEKRGIEVFTIDNGKYNSGQDMMSIAFIQYYKPLENSNVKFYCYQPDNGAYNGDVLNQYYTFTPNLEKKDVDNWNRIQCGQSVGCCAIKYDYVNCDKRRKDDKGNYTEDKEAYFQREYNQITKLDLKDAIFISIPDNLNDRPPQATYPGGARFDINEQRAKEYKDKQPLFTIKSELVSINKDTNIVLSGAFTFFRDRIYLPYAENREGKYNGLGDSNVYFSIKFGDYYYTGNNSKGKKGWVKEFAVTPVPLDVKTGQEAKNMFGTKYDIKDVTRWADRTTDKEGFIVGFPLEGTETMTEQIEITFYRPFGLDTGYPTRFCLLENFNVDIIVNEDIYNVDADTDSNTVYTNIIDNSFVTELSDIDFKICTWDNKKPNYSAVVVREGGNTYYLDKTFNKANYAGEQAWTGSDIEKPSADDGLRQEEHLIYKLVKQYSTPSVILNLPLRNDNKIYGLYKDFTIANKDFIIDTMGIDYKYNTAEIKLIEKK